MEKPFSPPSPVQPAGRCSQAAAAMEQRSAGAAGRAHSSQTLPGAPVLSNWPRGASRGIMARGETGAEKRIPKQSSLPQIPLASLFLGIGQLGGKALSTRAVG